MLRGMVLFAVVVVGLTWVLAGLMVLTQDSLKQYAGMLLLPAMVIPLIVVYVAHRYSGATGNPFAGLTWGNTSWYFLTWLAGLAAAALTLVVSVGLGLNKLDPGMTYYIDILTEQAIKSGAPTQEGMEAGFKIVGYATAFGAPTIMPWIGAAFGCLAIFPWYGWFFRRAMVAGRAQAIGIVMALSLVTGIVGGLAENPMWSELELWMRLLLTGFSALASVPAMAWILLKTRSAVIPALASASFQNGLVAAGPFLSIEYPLFSAPYGLLVSMVALMVGIALWVWKDPGGLDLAVAGVAFDGTPLTPEQLRRLSESPEPRPAETLVAASQPVTPPAVAGGLVPPPPTPGEIEALPLGDNRPDRSNIEQGTNGGG